MYFGETVLAPDVPEPCEFPSLVSCQRRFLWAHKEVDLAPHPIVGLALQIGDAEKLHTVSKYWLGSFSQSQQAGSMSESHGGE